LSLSLDQWQRSEILSVQVEQIECNEDTGRFSEQQILGDRSAFAIDARNLAVEHGIFDLQVCRDPDGEPSETAKRIPVSGDQLTFAIVDMRQCPEAVDLQLV